MNDNDHAALVDIEVEKCAAMRNHFMWNARMSKWAHRDGKGIVTDKGREIVGAWVKAARDQKPPTATGKDRRPAMLTDCERKALMRELVGIWDHAAIHYNDEYKAAHPMSKHAAISAVADKIDLLLAERQETTVPLCRCGHPKSDHYTYILNGNETWSCKSCDPTAGLPPGDYEFDGSTMDARIAADHPFEPAHRPEPVPLDAHDDVSAAALAIYTFDHRRTQDAADWIDLSEELQLRYRQMARAALAAAGPDLQRDIALWAQQTFDKPDQDHRLTKLGNEFEELRRLTTTDRANQAEIADECADIMHLMFQIAEAWGFDLLDETRKKFEVNKQRTWAAQPDGTYQHREEPRNDTD